MTNRAVPATYDDPLVPSRVDPFIRDVTASGARMVAELSDKINTVSVLKSMQLGYLMACEDHGLPLPEFADPEEIVFGKNRP